MRELRVHVQRDHLERMATSRRPVDAIAELIWNALDADASRVQVEVVENGLGGINTIRVVDNGHGIPYEEALRSFESLGGSKKRAGGRSPGGRALHGRAGEGRFGAFSVGQRVTWSTRWRNSGKIDRFEIVGTRGELGLFRVEDPVPSQETETGTEVRIDDVDRPFGSIRSARTVQDVTEALALYLHEYSNITVKYDGIIIDPKVVEKRIDNVQIEIQLRDGRKIGAELTIIEWSIDVDRALLLCDLSGFPLRRMSPGIQAPGFSFTAHLKSDLVRELANRHVLELDELDPDANTMVETAKAAMRDYFRKRTAESAAEVVETWKAQDIYPYREQPKDVVEQAEREVFDVIALNINSYLPSFEASDTKSKKLSLHMLKHALEQSPQDVQRIVQEVLDLPKEKQQELSELLQKTTLTAIINAAKIVGDRLQFVSGLEALVFSADTKKRLLERSQLHRILAENTWIFGEEFNLTVDDQSLKEVLRKHLALLGNEPPHLDPVVPLDGKETAIVDLMLSRVLQPARAEEREHLVIELKRPSETLSPKAMEQLLGYAFTVAEDERFRNLKTRWTFWLVGNDMNAMLKRQVTKQRDRPDGMAHQTDDQAITVWVKTWSEIVQTCKSRLHFFQARLQYMADHDAGLEYLHKMYEKYLPKKLQSPEPRSQPAPEPAPTSGLPQP